MESRDFYKVTEISPGPGYYNFYSDFGKGKWLLI